MIEKMGGGNRDYFIPIIYFVVPCYNEEKMLSFTFEALEEKFNTLVKLNKISKDSKIVLIDDGSKDSTWNLIDEKVKTNDKFIGIKLSKNQGHQNAILASLIFSKKFSDATISLDADLQDDIDAIDKMLNAYLEDNCDIVYGVRNDREVDRKFKKYTALAFYKIMESLGVNIVYNHADYRLISKKALEELENFKEVNLFLRALIPMLGFKSEKVFYERKARIAGESKYPFKKMLSFAWEGITSFSAKPISFITYLGFLVFS